jgi:hypothetical protein
MNKASTSKPPSPASNDDLMGRYLELVDRCLTSAEKRRTKDQGRQTGRRDTPERTDQRIISGAVALITDPPTAKSYRLFLPASLAAAHRAFAARASFRRVAAECLRRFPFNLPLKVDRPNLDLPSARSRMAITRSIRRNPSLNASTTPSLSVIVHIIRLSSFHSFRSYCFLSDRLLRLKPSRGFYGTTTAQAIYCESCL